MSIRSIIVSTGSYLPERILRNADLEKMVDTSDDWITQRTGIRERRIASEKETTGDMAVNAASEALAKAGLTGADIDGVIVATTTPDQTFPSVAVKVQNRLGIKPGPAFDVQAVCSGFLYALATADSLIRANGLQRLLVLGAEKMSAILDWEDRTTCVLFGDGAAAVVLERDTQAQGSIEDRGVLSTHLYADGAYQNLLYTNGGAATTGTAGHIVMQGREVFKQAVNRMAEVVEEALAENGITAEDVDWLVPHQANIRILEATAKKLGLSMDKIVVSVDRHGNTSAASIPLALDEAVTSGRIHKGDLLLMEAMGGGMTWGSALVRF